MNIGTVVALKIGFNNRNDFIRSSVGGVSVRSRTVEAYIGINSLYSLLDSTVKIFFIDRLKQIIACTVTKSMLGIREIVIAADNDILAVGEFLMCLLQKGTAIHNRHTHVYKYNIRMKFTHGGKSVLTINCIMGGLNAIVGKMSQFGNCNLDRFFIIND